ncbi:cytochrome P450 [Xylariales sp. AK1849]|nr:cytochrome P450 [Xylariales sp. AK1849]
MEHSWFRVDGWSLLGQVLVWFPILFISMYILKGIYRITLHPLAKFPGPKLTAMTRCYEAYYEVFAGGTGGKFGEKIEEWHRQYGPIVRINPFELHVNDPEYFEELFNFNPHLWKRTFAIDNLVHTPSSAQHKQRRQVLQNYFSQQKTNQMTHIVRERIQALCNHLIAHKGGGEPVKASLMFRAMTTDIICEYAFGRHWGFVEDPEYSEGYFSATQNTFKNIYFFREYPIVNDIALGLSALPDWLFPKGNLKNKLRQHTYRAMAHEIRHEKDEGSPPTIFEEYKTNKLPPEEKSPNRIFQVALMVMGAGAGTPSYVLDIATYYILADPAIRDRVKADLASVWPNADTPAPEVAVLEGLPFLRGCIKEALRLALGPMARLQRLNPHEEMRFREWIIPKGTPIGMTHRFIHHNPDIYPDPFEFRPERWMQGDKSRELERYLVTFSRGSRQCLAIPLAYAELYLCLATLFRRFNLELYETDRSCVDPKYDYFAPFPKKHDLSNERLRLLVQY